MTFEKKDNNKIEVIIISNYPKKLAREINPLGENKPSVKFFMKKWERAEEKLRTFEIEACMLNCSCDRYNVEPSHNCGKPGCKFMAEILPNGNIRILPDE